MFSKLILSSFFRDCRSLVWKNAWRPFTSRAMSSSNVSVRYTFNTRSFMSGQKKSNSGKDEPQNLAQSNERHGRILEFERALFRRMEQAGFKRSKKFYWTVFASSILVIGGGYLYLFPHKLRQQVVEEVSTVASQSLEDEKIVTKAGQLSKDVLNAILNDEGTKTVASDFVKDVIVSDPIRNAAIGTILRLLNDPEVLNLLRVRLSEIILAILQDESTRQIVLSQVNIILQHDSIRQSLQMLLSDLTNTPEVQKMMSDFFRDVLSSDTVKNQGAILGQQVTADVISSKDIQEQAGNAIWSALKRSVIPNIFRGKGSDGKDKIGENNNKENVENPTENSQDQKNTTPEVDTKTHDFEIPVSYSEAYDRYNRYALDDDI